LAALLSLDIASSAAASHGAWRTHVPSLRQLRRHLQDCEARRERLANRVRLQRTRPLPPWLGDDLDPDEQVLITAVDEDELGRAEAAVATAARELALAVHGSEPPAPHHSRPEFKTLYVREAGGSRADQRRPQATGGRPSLRSGIVFLGGCLALIAVMQMAAGAEPSTGTLAAIGSGCLLYAAAMRLYPNTRAGFVFAGACLVLLAGLHVLSGISPTVGGLAAAAVASLVCGLVRRAR
jgi:hypothetical protein